MPLSKTIKRPERVYLVNVDTNASMECLFNPTRLSEKIAVNWNRPGVVSIPKTLL